MKSQDKMFTTKCPSSYSILGASGQNSSIDFLGVLRTVSPNMEQAKRKTCLFSHCQGDSGMQLHLADGQHGHVTYDTYNQEQLKLCVAGLQYNF